MRTIRNIIPIFLLLFFFVALEVKADETIDNLFTVTIHKRIFDTDRAEDIQNNGSEFDIGGKPLPGAEFQIYDVSNRYYALLRQHSTSLDAVKQLQQELLTKVPEQSLAKGETDLNGVAIFSQLMKQAEGEDKIYAVVETGVPKGFTIEKKATPTIIITPVYQLNEEGKPSDEELENVHVYPKNIGYSSVIPEKPRQPTEPKKPALPDTGQAKNILSLVGFFILCISIWLGYKKFQVQS